MIRSRFDQTLFIAIPCFKQVEGIQEFAERLRAVCVEFIDLKVKIPFIYDVRKYGRRFLLHQFAAQDPRIQVVCFDRNFGRRIAATLSCWSKSICRASPMSWAK
jgi:hypothetical protein